MLTRLRQFVLHPGLIPANYLDELKKAEAGAVEIRAGPFTPEEKSKLQEALHRAVEECEECPLCFDVLRDDAVITTCAHSFCSDW
jgi:SWI/SNF-related matrix-associated actin-dependent regulator of chromatin subfamily A3